MEKILAVAQNMKHRITTPGTCLVQWLRFHISNARGSSPIPDLRTKISHAAQWGQKKKGRTSTLSSNSTPGYHAREIKTSVYTKTCTQIFIAALFIIAENVNNPYVHLLGNECYMYYIHTMEYYISSLWTTKLKENLSQKVGEFCSSYWIRKKWITDNMLQHR